MKLEKPDLIKIIKIATLTLGIVVVVQCLVLYFASIRITPEITDKIALPLLSKFLVKISWLYWLAILSFIIWIVTICYWCEFWLEHSPFYIYFYIIGMGLSSCFLSLLILMGYLFPILKFL